MTIADDHNPFATRHVRPGAIDFLFLAESDGGVQRLVERLAANHWWGEVVGPHGSGKSTLLAALRQPLLSAGRDIRAFVITAATTRPGIFSWGERDWTAATQVIVDGYELLGGLRQWWLKRLCRKKRAGLLVTAHQRMGLPTLVETRVTPELARAVIERLLTNEVRDCLRPTDIDDALAAHPDNLRELLFYLYDRYERRIRERSR